MNLKKLLKIPFNLKSFLKVLYLGLAFAFFAGFWVFDIFRVTYLITLLLWIIPNTRAVVQELILSLHQIWKPRWTWTLLTLLTLMFVGLWVLDVRALNSSYIDYGHYVQLIHNYVYHGQPIYTFYGYDLNYFGEHRSLSIYLLYVIYWIFPSSLSIAVYQAFGYIAPMWILSLWAWKKGIPAFQVFLCGFLYTLTWSFLAQVTWPLTTHILGLSFLSLAFVFYNLSRPSLWAVSLGLLLLEKEDFGLISLSFALGVLVYQGLKKKNSMPHRPRRQWILASCLVLAASVWGLSFKSVNRGFGVMFGHLGQSPGELVLNLIKNPALIMQSYFNPVSLGYLGFFLLVGGFWIRFRLKNLIYLFPVIPNLLVNCLGRPETPMREIGSYFSLLVSLGVYASLVFPLGVARLNTKSSVKITSWWLLLIGFQFCLAGKTIPRDFFHSIRDYQLSREDREKASLYTGLQTESLTLCCERFSCGGFSQRQRVYDMAVCLKKPELTDKTTIYLFDHTVDATIQVPALGFSPLMQGQRFSIYQKD